MPFNLTTKIDGKSLLVAIFLLPCQLYAQEESRIIGTWKTYMSTKKSVVKNCSGIETRVFTFSEDGTYITNEKSTSQGKKYFQHGTWTYNGKFLTFNTLDGQNNSTGAYKLKLKWINGNLFYCRRGREGKYGPMVYQSYCKL